MLGYDCLIQLRATARNRMTRTEAAMATINVKIYRRQRVVAAGTIDDASPKALVFDAAQEGLRVGGTVIVTKATGTNAGETHRTKISAVTDTTHVTMVHAFPFAAG